jgi:mannosyltransferase OCH1-like enzyme
MSHTIEPRIDTTYIKTQKIPRVIYQTYKTKNIPIMIVKNAINT